MEDVLKKLERYFNKRADDSVVQSTDPELTKTQCQNRIALALAFRHSAWKVAQARARMLRTHMNEDQVRRDISGALKNTIQAHGPITSDHLFSATKRVYGALKPYRQEIERLRLLLKAQRWLW